VVRTVRLIEYSHLGIVVSLIWQQNWCLCTDVCFTKTEQLTADRLHNLCR